MASPPSLATTGKPIASAAATASAAVLTTRSSGNGHPEGTEQFLRVGLGQGGHRRDSNERRPRDREPDLNRGSGQALERGPEEVADRLDAGLERLLGHRVAAQQALEEVHVAEVVEDGAVAADDQLLGVVAAEAAGVHLALEVGHRPLEPGPQGLAQVDAEVGAVGQGLVADEPHEVAVVGEPPHPAVSTRSVWLQPDGASPVGVSQSICLVDQSMRSAQSARARSKTAW